MQQITIKALARELNLSVSTISKALRDSHEISPATKSRVLQLAARLNYQTNPYASSLRGKKSRNIGIVIPEVADSFFSLAINGIDATIKAKGYHSIICLTHEDFSNEQAILKELQNGRVDGVLMSVSSETTSGKHIRALMEQHVPVVLFDRVLTDIPSAQVITDDMASSYNATQHLLRNGCKRIAFLGLSQQLSISADRLRGYENALRGHNITPSPKHILTCTPDPKKNMALIKKLLQQKERPDGIVAAVEKLAPLVYQACGQLSLRIPQDVKVVCFSNLELAGLLQPSLTTVTQPAFEMGKKAAEVLLRLLDSKPLQKGDMQVVIASRLVERNSTNGKI
ncbi:LacI family DNA-binding transcriptional regulator [Chitinophaga deserti]|uniref:LacI family DNA-binding transcriptional regulator n=1 Tax=Chitinophaga deserti TaxID=2164099 RepID=UPI000D6B6FF7|nr:LacI family DNA-binding transcriptional regulator [Chitinophaga deserti]